MSEKRSPESGVRDLETEFRSQKSEMRSLISEKRDQVSGYRREKSEVESLECGVLCQKKRIKESGVRI